MDRIIGIPPDQINHDDYVFMASESSALPRLWHIEYYDLPAVWAKFRQYGQEPGAGEVIAILDTGYYDHSLLPTPVAMRSFVGEPIRDRNEHSTHCAGIALGREGLGAAPGAELIIAKILSDGGSGSTRGINEGRVWAAREGATVCSESFGDSGGPPIREDLESYDEAYSEGLRIAVTASGNAGNRGQGRPGSYDRNVCVANHEEDGGIAPSSSTGPMVDVAGPGTRIISSGVRGPDYLTVKTGTSMSTPFIAGCQALVQHWMRITGHVAPTGPAAWRSWWAGAGVLDDVGPPGRDNAFGHGILNWKKVFQVILDSDWG